VLHHPKEYLVSAKIPSRDKTNVRKIDELIGQHVFLKELGERLSHDLDDIVNGSISSRERVEKAAPAIHRNDATAQLLQAMMDRTASATVAVPLHFVGVKKMALSHDLHDGFPVGIQTLRVSLQSLVSSE
jgi:hypothetical protein